MVTLVIIAVTCLVSILCFYGKLDVRRLWFTADGVWHRKECYQMISYGFVHRGGGQLFFNLVTHYYFSGAV